MFVTNLETRTFTTLQVSNCIDTSVIRDELWFCEYFPQNVHNFGLMHLNYSISNLDPEWCEFLALAEKWEKDTEYHSSIIHISMDESYQRIIGMGEKAIPYILQKLKEEGDEPNHWFWALKALTCYNPIADSDRGNMKKMAEAWLNWGKRNDYIS